MFKSTIGLLATSLSLLVSAAGCGDASTDAPPAQGSLEGLWVSPACEVYPGTPGSPSYLKRDTEFTATGFTAVSTLYADAACSAPLWSTTIVATYSIGADSASVAGAKEIDHAITDRQLTPLSNDGVAALNGAMAGSCGDGAWSLNKAASIAAGGCALAGVPSIAQCPVLHDLMKLEGDKLFNGDYVVGVDACKERLTSLSPLFLIRAK